MAGCEHVTAERIRVCRHLCDRDIAGHTVRFVGRGTEREYVCTDCIAAPAEHEMCALCREQLASSDEIGIVGAPEILDEPSDITFEHRRLRTPMHFADVQPLLGSERSRWLGVTSDGELAILDGDRGELSFVMYITVPRFEQPMLRVSKDGRLAAVVDRLGGHGVVVDVEQRKALMPLAREGDSHNEHRVYSIAFVEHAGRTLVVHAPEWNRLDVVDPRTGVTLTERTSPEHRGPHYLDYFHCGLSVSPDDRWIVDNGWVWHPVGIVAAWSIERWLGGNVWESEDGDSRRALEWCEGYWDRPLCWLDDHRVIISSWGRDERRLVDAARIFDVTTGEEVRWFAGPRGELVCDRRELVANDGKALTLWNVERGTRLVELPWDRAMYYHPTARTLLSLGDEAVLTIPRGHDARADWNRGIVRDLARGIVDERAFEDLPVLGDALESAGCTDAGILSHCQNPGPHADRCWVLDRLM